MRLADLHATFLGEVAVPPEHRDAINAARRRTFHALAPLAAIHSLLNAVILTFAFWGHAGMPLVFVWCYTSACEKHTAQLAFWMAGSMTRVSFATRSSRARFGAR
jgi:hypothetical protein